MNTQPIVEQIPALRRYARALTGDTWAADDLVQDTLERACRKWRLWTAGSDLRAWLFTMMHNLSVNQVRRATRHSQGTTVDIDDVAHKLMAPDAGLGQALDLQDCLLRLPPDQRTILLLISVEDMSYRQVAQIVGVPIGTVMSRLSRARSRLQELLDAPAHRPSAASGQRDAVDSAHEMSYRNKTMDRTPSPPLTEDEIHALADDQSPPGQCVALRARLAHDPAAQATVLKWQQQRDALRGLHQHMLDETVPATLMTAAQQTAVSQQEINPWWRWGGVAAGVMLAFGTGWLSSTAWYGDGPSRAGTATLARAPAVKDFVRQAGLAHAVYAPEIRHPVEVTAAEQEHLVQWLSKRVGRPLKLPHLGAQGYELVGGRLLPGDAGARAQFMFQNAGGTRITLYLGAVDKTALGAELQGTGFQFGADGPFPSFYWVDQGFGYALAGPLPREALMKLAEAVYRQL